MKCRAVAFDLDGVLADVWSSWDWVHSHYGTNNEESYLAYKRGEIDDSEFMRRDIALWKSRKKPLHYRDIERTLEEVRLMKGARETVQTLREHGIKTAVVSAGLMPLAKRVARETGIEYVYANDLAVDGEGYILGEGVLKVALDDKATPFLSFLAEIDVEPHEAAAVGNSYIDIPMMKKAGLGIAFNADDDDVARAADVVIEEKDLRFILPHILPPRKWKTP
ncbi:MAG: HAD-IB family phosphatase [Thermoplasmata archaeon]|nr:HAD-IB family phosphatase [Thermoplasmata archaeon]